MTTYANSNTLTPLPPSFTAQRLECVGGGPWDGQPRDLPAGEYELYAPHGRYEKTGHARAEAGLLRYSVVLHWMPDDT